MTPVRVAVLVFPGSNNDVDAQLALNRLDGCEASLVWHTETSLQGYDAVVVPGGFSYGDTLRAGAIARFSPVVGALQAFAKNDQGPILGICNGFQILCEAELLPGALAPNAHAHYVCQHQHLTVATQNCLFTNGYQPEYTVDFPIGHGSGCYVVDDATLATLKAEDRIAFTYFGENPNGSVANIAGVLSKNRRILGLMPHPERNARPGFGTGDGRELLESFVHAARERAHG